MLFLSSIVSPCFVCDLGGFRSDLPASAADATFCSTESPSIQYQLVQLSVSLPCCEMAEQAAATVVAVERTTAANLDSATFKASLLSHTAAIVPPPMSRSPSLAPSPAAARAMPVPMPKSGSPARRPSRSPLRQRWARAGAAIIASRRLLSKQEILAQRRLALLTASAYDAEVTD